MNLAAIQKALGESGIDGWLFCDFRGSDPIAFKVLGLSQQSAGSRRWYYYIPATGEPVGLVHRIESGNLDTLPGRKLPYLSWKSLASGLQQMLEGSRRVAMQYSPDNHIPTVSRVDGGTIELVRSMGVEVISSADLVQRFEACLSAEQVESHRRSAKVLRAVVDEVFDHLATGIRSGHEITELSLQSLALSLLERNQLVTPLKPIVAVNAHAADPHFEVSEAASVTVREGDLVLFDIWAKERAPGSIFADITWCAYVGKTPPEEMTKVFNVVRDAREAAISCCEEAFRTATTLRGFEVDRAARAQIEAAGFGDHFIHRTGHSIHEETHGNGANMDDLETHDTRCLVPWTLFSIEPGIYLPGRFGIRSEVNVLHAGDRAEVTGPPRQEQLIPLL